VFPFFAEPADFFPGLDPATTPLLYVLYALILASQHGGQPGKIGNGRIRQWWPATTALLYVGIIFTNDPFMLESAHPNRSALSRLQQFFERRGDGMTWLIQLDSKGHINIILSLSRSKKQRNCLRIAFKYRVPAFQVFLNRTSFSYDPIVCSSTMNYVLTFMTIIRSIWLLQVFKKAYSGRELGFFFRCNNFFYGFPVIREL
jgi:hypothetical protein